MPDYNESTITGHAWQRCSQIVIDNARGITPVVRFDEEQVIALDGVGEAKKTLGTLAVEFDPAVEIPLRDPQSGELTGDVMTFGEVYAVLYSAYIDAALKRDARNTPINPIQPE